MKYYRLIAPDWLLKQHPDLQKVLEGMFSDDDIKSLNEAGYNVYYFPNHPKKYDLNRTVNGSQIDQFDYVFVDYDCKSEVYKSKEDFIDLLKRLFNAPTLIVDSGNGVHAYWQVSDLDVKSYQRLTRRMMRMFKTDESTCMICQLMRMPGTLNTKEQNNFKPCKIVYEKPRPLYTCEELDKLLPPITVEDEAFCQQHYDRTYNISDKSITIDDELPPKFGKLLKENHEVADLFAGATDDRSKNDYRLGHVMYANKFTKEEAMSVLVNTAKAMSRAPVHRIAYAENIVNKIWTYETETETSDSELSYSVKDILHRSGDTIKGTQLRCHPCVDNTERGYRLGDVIGLVAGSGVGKTAFSMNMFKWFAQNNPDYHHFFVPLEQPSNEIAERWKTMCGEDTSLHSKVHVMSNYDNAGNFRHLSLDEIQEYLVSWQVKTGHKIGCVVIDHIGALKKKGSNDENQDLMTICHKMKSFAIQTNTLLVMQSQTSRQKAGIGDQELDKDSAYGTLFFEAYCDYLITLWQPLKRCHAEESCPTVTAFKFCKIRHKKAKLDVIKEDVPYYLYFDSTAEMLRNLTQDEKTSFDYFLPKATNKRKADRRSELVAYISAPYERVVPENASEQEQKKVH